MLFDYLISSRKEQSTEQRQEPGLVPVPEEWRAALMALFTPLGEGMDPWTAPAASPEEKEHSSLHSCT